MKSLLVFLLYLENQLYFFFSLLLIPVFVSSCEQYNLMAYFQKSKHPSDNDTPDPDALCKRCIFLLIFIPVHSMSLLSEMLKLKTKVEEQETLFNAYLKTYVSEKSVGPTFRDGTFKWQLITPK